jgi:hypothetical protein
MTQCIRKSHSECRMAELIDEERCSNIPSIRRSSAGCELFLQQSSYTPDPSYPIDVKM